MKRHNLKLAYAKKRTQLTEAEVASKAQILHNMVWRCLPNVDAVINIDEVPISLAGSMTAKLRTVTLGTDNDVRVNYDAGAFRRSATFIAGAIAVKDGTGWKGHPLQPFIIFKGSPSQKRVLEERYAEGCKVCWTKHGVINGVMMRTLVLPHIRAQCDALGVNRALLILDSARAHLTAEVTRASWGMRMPLAVVPAGCTSWLQWVDTHFAGAYKSRHVSAFGKWSSAKLTVSQKRRLLTRIVVESAVSPHIVKDFKSLGYLDPREATIRNIEYTFKPPELTAAELAADRERMLNNIIEAAATPAPAAAPTPAPTPLGRPPARLQPPQGYGGDIRRFFAPRQQETAPAAQPDQ